MAAPAQQSFSNHRRFMPLYHFVAIPILTVNLLLAIYVFYRAPGKMTAWGIILAIGLVAGFLALRISVLIVQNRIIRLEMRHRLRDVLPSDLHNRIGELTPQQLIALRFASDAELPALVRDVLAGNLATQKAIKERVKNWQGDHLRV